MKILSFLLITAFFATIGFAEVSHQSDETNKKIEKIEEKLDTTKEELIKYTQITDDTKERVGDISSSVDRFTTALSIFGTLVTIVLIFVAWSSRNSAISEAKNTAQEEAQKQFDKWVKEKAKDFAEKEVYFEKIMNDKIKLFEDNVDVKTIQIMFENAVGYGRNKQHAEALKIYNEIINSYGNSQNETIIVKVAESIVNKGVNIGRQDKPEEAMKIYEEFITTYKDSKIDGLIEQVKIAVKNKLELEIVLDKPISNYKTLIEKLIQTPIDLIIVDMLFILENAKTIPQDTELKLWLEKYKNLKYLVWDFRELEGWITNTSHSHDVKQRIQSYIEIFKTHLHRA
jgi:TolA-binding protein